MQSRTFIDRLLRNSTFARKVISLFVDEAHCISHWGAEFRKKYATLGNLRAFLPAHTPVIAVSATLTPRVRRDVTIPECNEERIVPIRTGPFTALVRHGFRCQTVGVSRVYIEMLSVF